MADQFKTLWECGECFEIYMCCEVAKATTCHFDAHPLYRCEVCGRDRDTEADARSCCFKIANPIPAARREVETRPLPAYLSEPELGVRRKIEQLPLINFDEVGA
jgi:hypothetical protein